MKSARHKNQYTIRSEAQERSASYEWLLSSLKPPSSLTEAFDSEYTCWIPSGQGISKTMSGYLRFNHIGKKVFCHVFAWRHHHNSDHHQAAGRGDVSHLCRNKQCCRPSHLVREDRATNKSRDNCPGIVSCSLHEEEAFQLCKHKPRRCLWITTFTCTSDKVSLKRP